MAGAIILQLPNTTLPEVDLNGLIGSGIRPRRVGEPAIASRWYYTLRFKSIALYSDTPRRNARYTIQRRSDRLVRRRYDPESVEVENR